MTPNQYTFRYRVRNGSDYNRALIARGRLTFWFDEDAVAAWRNADPPKGPGAAKVYSDTAIQCALILKSCFILAFGRRRASFLRSWSCSDSICQFQTTALSVDDRVPWRRS